MMYFSSFCNCNITHQQQFPQHRIKRVTYILPDNRSKARAPQDALSRDLIHKQALTTKHRFPDALRLILRHDALGTGEERVFPDAPRLVASQLDDGDVANSSGREQEFAGAGVARFGHVTADEGFLEGEFHGAFEGHSRGHCDHGAWSGVSISLIQRAYEGMAHQVAQ